jgi:TrpR family trp operon transcriptional repressor
MKTDEGMIDILCGITDKAEMKKLFSEIFTPAELDDLTLRWKLIRELSKGKTQREVARDLGISLCKITRGSRLLKDRHSVVRKIFVGDND